MRLNWLPWKYIVRRVARSHGLLDPVLLLSRLNRFAQPSEVAAPVELFRASLVFHARGLINARTIQTNLDWIWPFWVHKQFNPTDPAFVPRSYTITHVNLTYRNWTAVGLPDCNAYPIVDPRGLTTPFFDGWSLDGWIVSDDGEELIPSRSGDVTQHLRFDHRQLAVETISRQNGMQLSTTADVILRDGDPCCRIRYRAASDKPAAFVVSLRPCNPEGISFVHHIRVLSQGAGWTVNKNADVRFDTPMDRHKVSDFHEGDVYRHLAERPERRKIECNVGMASAAAIYDMAPGQSREVTVLVNLADDPEPIELFPADHPRTEWAEALEGICRLRVPDKRIQFLYDAAVRGMILHSPLDVYPGPFYYKRFWFRDAAFILFPMLSVGLHDRAQRLIDQFPGRQSSDGYFRSQQGEWDSNGQVMWIMNRFCRMTGRSAKPDWLVALLKAGKWIQQKRLPADGSSFHAGLLPAGFSAEHLGHNDFYYWDDFWSVAGLQAGADVCDAWNEPDVAHHFRGFAADLTDCIERSLQESDGVRHHPGIPASPHRRMDSGAIGSVVAGYPLQLLDARDPRLLATVDYLLEQCFIENAFFQDMFHAGYNVYLSLHCAQVLLRAGDCRFLPIVERVAELASSTGQWPEAIHPRTLGGCQGDGQHIWAAAEWVMMLRNMFVREEGETLVLLQGIPDSWLENGEPVEMGPVYTDSGAVTVQAVRTRDGIKVTWQGSWWNEPPRIAIRMPGRPPVDGTCGEGGEVLI